MIFNDLPRKWSTLGHLLFDLEFGLEAGDMEPSGPVTIGADESFERLIDERRDERGRPDHVQVIAIQAQPEEPLSDALMAGWDAIRLGDDIAPGLLSVED